MSEAFRELLAKDLELLATALRSGWLAPPYTALSIQRYLAAEPAAAAAREIEGAGGAEIRPRHLAWFLEALAAERARRQGEADRVDLVSTGPESPGVSNRDTAVVVRELFAQTRREVVVAGYAVYQGRRVFQALAERMDEVPELKVRMYLDVRRESSSTARDSEVLARFATRFQRDDWPGRRLPEVFYDPRSLEPDPAKRASLHAKCVVVDGEAAFISSANFTEAAQARNIEVGVLIRSKALAEKVAAHFGALAAAGVLQRVAGIAGAG